REGLDIPEVSLVAVLDADKEGFLRSERSLIQTAGRAARNLNGQVIFYANSITRSMKSAMDEAQRRRDIQMAFNAAHGITPKGVTKRIKDIIDGVYDKDEAQKERKAAQEQAKYSMLDEKDVLKEMKKVEKAMHDAAKNLEFEKAADYRDQLKKLRILFYGAEIKDLKE
ncbi:MAG TPA: UvrB/UvrC motif-containing protein, partial [Rugosibacter sp.]|nr:UvrB/UvrC motif-containing protein [Rugosibacter sp.]